MTTKARHLENLSQNTTLFLTLMHVLETRKAAQCFLHTGVYFFVPLYCLPCASHNLPECYQDINSILFSVIQATDKSGRQIIWESILKDRSEYN